MKIFFTGILLAIMSFQLLCAKSINDSDRMKSLEGKCSVLQRKQTDMDDNLRKLAEKQRVSECKVLSLGKENDIQRQTIDSLQNVCKDLEKAQSVDRKHMNRKIAVTNNHVRVNQNMLQTRTLWGIMIVISFLVVVVGVAYCLTKRIKSGNSTIIDIRKVQEALQSAQTKMQEEAVKLDDKLLELFDRQMSSSSKMVDNDKPDHSLALKVADEIVRIELNMSRMDSSIKGYKQLIKAVERIKDNFKANGYEIVDMLGKPYNEGMKVTANFVADEDLEEGKQIITGITKPQINYNGQMIQAAQITVSQNI